MRIAYSTILREGTTDLTLTTEAVAAINPDVFRHDHALLIELHVLQKLEHSFHISIRLIPSRKRQAYRLRVGDNRRRRLSLMISSRQL